MKRYVVLVSSVAALGGLLFGFDTAVVAGTLGHLKATYGLDEVRQGWVVSSALLGCMPGALVSGPLTDRFGRRPVLLLASLFYLVSALWSAAVSSEAELVWARIVGGVAIGFASTTAPIYISEVAPPAYRGRLGMLTQLTITLGILLSYVSNYLIDGSPSVISWLGNDAHAVWRPMFGVAAFPSLLFLLALLFIPESPRWLALNGRPREALPILERLSGSPVAASLELSAIERSVHDDALTERGWLIEAPYRRVVSIGFFFAVLCLLTGINVVLYYAPLIFERTKVGLSPLLQTMLTGVILFLCTILALFLIDRLGRKKLLLWGSWLMAGSMVGLSALFYGDALDNYGVLVLTLVFIGAFATTWGSVVWVLIGEMFPNGIRGKATAIANFGNWLTNFLVSVSFPWMLAHWGGSGSFAFYAMANLLAIGFVSRYIVETKGVPLEEMQTLY